MMMSPACHEGGELSIVSPANPAGTMTQSSAAACRACTNSSSEPEPVAPSSASPATTSALTS